MNADQLIDFVLGQLDGTDHEQIEHAIQTDPDVAHRSSGSAGRFTCCSTTARRSNLLPDWHAIPWHWLLSRD